MEDVILHFHSALYLFDNAYLGYEIAQFLPFIFNSFTWEEKLIFVLVELSLLLLSNQQSHLDACQAERRSASQSTIRG